MPEPAPVTTATLSVKCVMGSSQISDTDSIRNRRYRISRRGASTVATVSDATTSWREPHLRQRWGRNHLVRRDPRRCRIARAACSQSSRACTMSSWLRPMKFHHMTSDSAKRRSADQHDGRVACRLQPDRSPGREPGIASAGASRRTRRPALARRPPGRACSNSGCRGTVAAAPAPRVSSAPTIGEYVMAGDSMSASRPTSTMARQPSPPVRGRSGRCSNAAGPVREPSGSATHSCRPCIIMWPPTETSECETPSPDVMRLSSPGRRTTSLPRLSRCRMSPAKGPRDGLQPGVRMRQHLHGFAGGTEVVDEAPGPDGRQAAMREGSVDGESTDAAQRHLARLEQEVPIHGVSVRGGTGRRVTT